MAVDEVGDGEVVIVFHPTPGSRFDARFWAKAAEGAGYSARFVGFDRPGYGEAAPEPGRTLQSVSAFAVRLAGATPVRLLAVSGGAPFALATAAELGSRACSVVVASGFGPPEMGLGALEPVASLDRSALRVWAEELIASSPQQEPTGVELIDLFLSSAVEGLRHPDGIVDDVLTVRQPWTFPLDAVTAPVTLFHAVDDDRCPVAGARHLAAVLPRARLLEWASGGHMAMAQHLSEVVDALKSPRDS